MPVMFDKGMMFNSFDETIDHDGQWPANCLGFNGPLPSLSELRWPNFLVTFSLRMMPSLGPRKVLRFQETGGGRRWHLGPNVRNLHRIPSPGNCRGEIGTWPDHCWQPWHQPLHFQKNSECVTVLQAFKCHAYSLSLVLECDVFNFNEALNTRTC